MVTSSSSQIIYPSTKLFSYPNIESLITADSNWLCPHHMLNPIFLMHSLCASISSPQFSSPFSTMQASRAFFVSGQAQHGLSFFSPCCGFSSSCVAAAVMGASPDIVLVHKIQFSDELTLLEDSSDREIDYVRYLKSLPTGNSCHACSYIPGFYFKMADSLLCVFLQPHITWP